MIDVVPSRRNRWRDGVVYFGVLPALVPGLLFVLLRPDWFTFQNGLDPYFYSGWAQNLGDAASVAGDAHYSVSRWSIYLPSRLFFVVFGAQYGFIFLRWLLVAAVFAAVLVFGHRRWGRLQSVVAATVVIVNPMFVRAIFSDYADVVLLPFGVVALVLLLQTRWPLWCSLGAGAAAGLCLVAQLFSLPMVAIMFAAALTATPSWRHRRQIAVFGSIGMSVVIGAGWLMFRWRYGIANVYGPSIDFARNYASGTDPLKKKQLNWLWYYLWIYSPPLVVAMCAVLVRARRIRLDRVEWAVLGALVAQYVFQIAWQFGRNGTTLELSYYWTYVLPTFTLGSSVLIGRCARAASPFAQLSLLGGLLLALIVFDRGPELLPNWAVAVIVVGAYALLAVLVAGRYPTVPLSFAILVPLALAYAYPRPLPLKVGDFGLDPQYQSVFHSTDSIGQRRFFAGSWLVEQIDKLPHDVERSMYYWAGGFDESFQMTAMELAQIDGRLINDWTSGDMLAPRLGALEMLDVGQIRWVALVGTVASRKAMSSTLTDHGLSFETVVEVAYDEAVTLQVIEMGPVPAE